MVNTGDRVFCAQVSTPESRKLAYKRRKVRQYAQAQGFEHITIHQD